MYPRQSIHQVGAAVAATNRKTRPSSVSRGTEELQPVLSNGNARQGGLISQKVQIIARFWMEGGSVLLFGKEFAKTRTSTDDCFVGLCDAL